MAENNVPEGVTFGAPATGAPTTPSTTPAVAPPAPPAAPPEGVTFGAPDKQPAPDTSGKVGFDLGTANSVVQGAESGLYGVAKGVATLPYQMVTGGPSKEESERLAAEGDAQKHKVYGKFTDDFRKGNYADAFKGLTDLFTSDAGTDPNDPIHQMLEQQWQSSQAAKKRAMESAKKGDYAGVLQHSVGVVPIASQVDGAMTAFQKNPTRDNLKEVVAAAIPAFIPALMKGAGKVVGAGVDATRGAIRGAVEPGTAVTPGGAEIPVRPETPTGRAAWAGAPEESAKLAQTRTSPAIEKAIGGTIGEATGSEAATAPSPADRMGLRGHAADLIEQAKAGYQHIDELSGNKLSDAQEAMDNSRRDFSKEGREAFKKASDDKQALLDQYRDSAAAKGIDVDAADAAYRKGIAVKKMAAKMDTATGVSEVEGAEHNLNGTRLAKVIDDGVKNGSWKQMGLTDDHIAELQKLGDIAKDQTNLPKTGRFMSGLGKAAVFAAGIHGGLFAAIEAASGVSAADALGSKIASHVVQDAVMNQDATEALTKGLKSGNGQAVVAALAKDPSWVERIKTYVQDQSKNIKNWTGGEEGAVGNVTKRKAGEPGTSSLIGKRGVKASAAAPETTLNYKQANMGDDNMQHSVTRTDAEGTKVGEIAAQDTAPGVVTVRSNQLYDESLRGKGAGREHIEHLADQLKSDPSKTTLKSDISTTEDGKRPWQSLEQKYPDAVTHKNYPDNHVQWSLDLSKWKAHAAEIGVAAKKVAGVADDVAAAVAKNEPGRTEGVPVLPTEKVGGTRISQRNPTAVNATENPITSDLNVGMDAIKKSDEAKPGFTSKLAQTVAKYPGVPITEEEAIANPTAALNKFVNHISDNLEWLHNQIPENVRGISKLWYDSAHELTKQWAAKYGVTHEQMAGVTASLSPQNEWNNNVETASRVVDIYKNKQNFEWSPEMQTKAAQLSARSPDLATAMKDITGKKLSDLDNPYDKAAWIRVYDESHNGRTMPNYAPDGSIRGLARNPVSQQPTTMHWSSTSGIAKAVSILEDGSKDNIHRALGDMHKVRNFYNNIIDPWSKSGDVTIDTHAVGAGHLRPMGGSSEEVMHNFGSSFKPTTAQAEAGMKSSSSQGSAMTGVQGTYGLYAEAYRQAAGKLGILPRELQSITWEGIRSLYESRAKTDELKGTISQIWKDHKNGELSIDRARKQILKAAGGFKNPKWLSDIGQNGAEGSTAKP